MNPSARPIPLATVVLMFPRWLRRGAIAVGAASVAAATVLACCSPDAFPDWPPRARTVTTIALFASGLALPGIVLAMRWVGARVRANGLFEALRGGPRTKLLRRAAMVLVPLCVLFGAGALVTGNVQAAVQVGVVNGALFATMAALEAVLWRCLRRQAAAIFTLYAEGQLAPADAAAIDDARAKDERFDAAVRDYQRVVAMVREVV